MMEMCIRDSIGLVKKETGGDRNDRRDDRGGRGRGGRGRDCLLYTSRCV